MDASRRTTKRTRVRAAAIAGLMLAGSVGAARAQYVYDDELLPPRVVAWRLSERGFSGLSRPRFDGRAYVVEAFAPNGARVRLFVDAREGDIVGRQRLDTPLYGPPVRVARPTAPGYGWTEEDAEPSRTVRQAERLVPPADIPFPAGRPLSPGPAARLAPPYPEPASRRAELPARPDAGAPNPLGVNPDARSRPEPARKSAKLTPPAKTAAPRLAPEAPAPKLVPSEPAPVAARQEPKATEPAAKPESAKPESGPPPTANAEPTKAGPVPTPASVQPPPTEAKVPDAKTADVKTAESAKGAESWKDPPPEKRAVRVIGGATIVPGADGKADATHTE